MSATELQKVMAERFGEDVEIISDDCPCGHTYGRHHDLSGCAVEDCECDASKAAMAADEKPALPMRTPQVMRHVDEIKQLWEWLVASPAASRIDSLSATYTLPTDGMLRAVQEALTADGVLPVSGLFVDSVELTMGLVSHVDAGVYRVIYLPVRDAS